MKPYNLASTCEVQLDLRIKLIKSIDDVEDF